MSSEEDDVNLPKENEEIKTKHNTYKVVKLLGKGGYGAVYEVIRASDKAKFAVKCETMACRKSVLPMDCRVLRGAQMINSKHFCTVEDRGRLEGRFLFLVMKLVGANLWDLRMDREDMKFTLNTSLKCAEQCLVAIEELHRIGFLHRDIKPGNFAVGRPEANDHHNIYLLDFGLCRKFAEKAKDIRIPREVAPFRGTTRYAPLAAMRQVEQSRKDDLEGWLYMVVEWTSGGLPWKKYKGDNRDEVMKMKEDVRESADALNTFFRNCPKREFTKIMEYLDNLHYFSIPDYAYVYYCIQHAFKANSIKPNAPIDWDMAHDYHGPSGAPGTGVAEKTQPEPQSKLDKIA